VRGRDFLDVARLVVTGGAEPYWRSTAVDAYYAMLLECRDTLVRWGFPQPRRDTVHAWVRLRFAYANNPDLRHIGDVIDRLVRLRNQASYHLQPSREFASPTRAQDAILESTTALALLDQIDGDPTRRAAAIAAVASLPP